MLQRLPAAALNKAGAFSASRAAPLRAAKRLSSVRPCFLGHVAVFLGVALFMSLLPAGQVRVFQLCVSQRIPGL
jgi:hypothetical protein